MNMLSPCGARCHALLATAALAMGSLPWATAQCGPGASQPYPPGQTTCPSGGAMGGGTSNAPVSTSSHAAAMLGDVGTTTIAGVEPYSNVVLPIGTHINGPFEAGFTSQQDNILVGLGCASGSLGYVAGGIDTHTAEQMVAYQCSVTLPRLVNNSWISLLGKCGGHTQDYHFHEGFTCLYNATGGHSTKVGQTVAGKPLYGKWEDTSASQLPTLDACGAHYGRTPESPNASVYHYHVQDRPPFTVGCAGPNDDGTVVTLAQCRAFYTGCDNVLVNVTTGAGTKQYDLWCPCFDASGSNVGPSTNTGGGAGTTPTASSGGVRGAAPVLALLLPFLVSRAGSV